MTSHVGALYAVSNEGLSTGMKGLVWSMMIDDKWYEVEFTGELSENRELLVKVKKETKAPGGYHV